MARLDYRTCEPFRAWNRLEGRSRKEDFDQSLRAEIHDPLWFLTRQWQFGEFKGEDTGSAIFAKIHIENTKISQFQLKRNTPAKSYSEDVPLETLVERESTSLDFKTRIQAAKHFMRILNKKFTGTADYNKADYLTALVGKYPYAIPALPDASDTDELLVQKAKQLTNHDLQQFHHIVKGRTFDGVVLYEDLSGGTNISGIVNVLASKDAHKVFIEQSLNAYMVWFQQKYMSLEDEESAWNAQQLEYQFGCAFPNTTGDNTVLTAEEYYSGKLDWYTFDVAADADQMKQSTSTVRESHISKDTLTIIPTETQFPGMPNSRWWEFEDGHVDLGNINASTTDVAKIILAEFVLIYGNDWFSMPYRVPVGSISEIKGIVVKDVFGQKTLVQAANQGENEDWTGWGMFNLSARKKQDALTLETGLVMQSDTRLFIPPTIAKVQESEPIEAVRFVRDEMANLVWALERTIPNLLGKGQEGDSAARELKLLYDKINGVEDQEITIEETAMLHYILGNSVPENWIPFMAVHSPGQNRKVRLQRAAMPRIMKEGYMPVRPRTNILKYGMNKSSQNAVLPFINADAEKQEEPYYIIEEEITKTGVHVVATNQRTRWYQGKTYNWRGRRKNLAKGEGSSGLLYDDVKFVQPKKV